MVDAESGSVRSVDAAAAVAGDTEVAARLGLAGVVALRAAGTVFEVQETVDGWQLEANPDTPDVGGLAMTAVVRATQLAAQRRGEDWRRATATPIWAATAPTPPWDDATGDS